MKKIRDTEGMRETEDSGELVTETNQRRVFNLRTSMYSQIAEEGNESGSNTPRRAMDTISDDEGSVNSHRCMLGKKRETRFNQTVLSKVKRVLT